MGKSILATFKTRLSQFVTGLRERGDTQVRGALCKTTYADTKDGVVQCKGFCALGVAIDLYREATGDGEWVRYDTGAGNEFCGLWYYKLEGDDRHYHNFMPGKVARWYGLDTGHSAGFSGKIIERNDSNGAPFGDIADYVESYVNYGHVASNGREYNRTGLLA